jgi:hypothetical protein
MIFKTSQSVVRLSAQWIRDFLSLLYNWVFIAIESMPSSKTRNNIEITTKVWDWITTASLRKRRADTKRDVEASAPIKLRRYGRNKIINRLFATEHKH